MTEAVVFSQVGAQVLLVAIVCVVATMFFLFVILLTKQYRRCPPNRILVVYGVGNAKCIHDGAAFVMPLIQDYAYLNCEPFRVELPQSLRAAGQAAAVPLPESFTVAIGMDAELMQNAAIRLIGLPPAEITRLAAELIVAKLENRLRQLCGGNQSFEPVALLEKWAAEVERELHQIGLTIIGYR